MKVLVTAASKYGSTMEVAQAVRDELFAAGVDAELRSPEDVRDLQGFDAAVIGSAVYAGHWLDPAKRLVEREADRMRAIPIWLFSVGPLGDPPKPDEEPVDVRALIESTKASEHRIFTGRLDRKQLNFVEKALVIALRAPEGDFRDWDAIRDWSRGISIALQEQP